MSDVFISYASKDRERAKALAEELAHSGLGVWWDRDLVAGDRFAESIQKELDAAKCVLVLWSQASVGSDWTREEAEEGKRANVLVLVFIDPGVEIPLGFRSVQTQNLVDWDGDVTDPRFRQLLEAVDKKLHRRRSITKLLALQPRWRSVSGLPRISSSSFHNEALAKNSMCRRHWYEVLMPRPKLKAEPGVYSGRPGIASAVSTPK